MTTSNRDTYRIGATGDEILPGGIVRCVYCNRRLVLGATSIIAHEEFCHDKAAVLRQQAHARDRFKRKQAESV